jgi:hypothetical protein
VAEVTAFEDYYEGTEDLDLGHGFSCTLRKYLSQDDFRAAGSALVRNRKWRETGIQTEVSGDYDAFSYYHAIVCAALVAWNLTRTVNKGTDNEKIVPIDITSRSKKEQEVARLPQPVFRKILARVLELNNEANEDGQQSAKADADFRSED